MLAGTYFAVSMLLVSLSLVLSVLVLNVHHRGDTVGKKVPAWLRKLFLSKGSACCVRGKTHGMLTVGNTSDTYSEIPNGGIPLRHVSTSNSKTDRSHLNYLCADALV